VIRNGEYGVHQKLPSESDLSFQYDTTRLTIRKSIEELQKRQLVVKDRNRGTFVLPPETKISSGANGLVGFTEAAESRHLKSETVLISLKSTSNVNQIVKEQLKLANDESIWAVERLRLINEEPMTDESIFLKKRFAPDLNEHNATGSLFKMIEDYVNIAYASQELEAVLLNGRIGKLLQVDKHLPAFLAHTTSYTADGYPILYDESFYRSDKYTFHNILYRNH